MMEEATIQKYLGRVTQVIDPDNFWMQIGTDQNLAEFSQFEITVEGYCQTMSSYPEDIDEVTMGQTLLVDCTETGHMWRRGHVSRIDRENEEVDVFYLDYGETELVDIERLCVHFPEQFIYFPAQAVKCCLAGVKPIARQWTSRAIKRFQELVQFDTFHTIVHACQPENYKVSLYTQNGDEERALCYQLLEEELALPSDDDVEEFYCDAPKQIQTLSVPNGGDHTDLDAEDMERLNTSQIADDPQQLSPGPRMYSSSTDTAPSTNSTEDENEEEIEGIQVSPAIIPSFNFDQIHKTKETSTDKLKEKEERHTQKRLEKEYERLKGELEEQAKLAEAVGYGKKDELELNSSGDEKDEAVKIEIPRAQVEAKPEIISNNHPTRRYGPMRKELPPRFQKLQEQRERSLTPELRGPDISSNKQAVQDKRKSHKEVPPRFQKRREHHQGATTAEYKETEVMLNIQDLNEPASDRQGNKEESGRGIKTNVEEIPKIKFGPESGDQIQELSPTKTNFLKLLNEICSQINREDVDLTTAKLRSLFATDLFIYLDKEQLQTVLNILLNRAVRHYGYIHDVLLEILELLKATTEDFEPCMLHSLKKLQDIYITKQMRGSPFHLPCAKILGHIFNLSLFWDDCAESVQKLIYGCVEKWIYFNKQGKQNGQKDLEEIYLVCFKTVWDITAHVLKERFPEKVKTLKWEFKDKIFNAEVSRSIKEQLFDLYMECFMLSGQESEPAASSVVTRSTASQTDVTPLMVYQGDIIGDQELSSMSDSKQRDHYANNKIMCRTSPSVPQQRLTSPGSVNNSVYFTPNQSMSSIDFPQLTTNNTITSETVNELRISKKSCEQTKSWVSAATSSSTTKDCEQPKLQDPTPLLQDYRNPDDCGDGNKISENPVFKIYAKCDEKHGSEEMDLGSSGQNIVNFSGHSVNRKTVEHSEEPKPLNLHTIMLDLLSSSNEPKANKCVRADTRTSINSVNHNDDSCNHFNQHAKTLKLPEEQTNTDKEVREKNLGCREKKDKENLDLRTDGFDTVLQKQTVKPLDHQSKSSKKVCTDKVVDWWSLGVDDEDDDSEEEFEIAYDNQQKKFSGEDEEGNISANVEEIKPEFIISMPNSQCKQPSEFEIDRFNMSSGQREQNKENFEDEMNSKFTTDSYTGDKSLSDSDRGWETVDEEKENDQNEETIGDPYFNDSQEIKNKRVPSGDDVINSSVTPPNERKTNVGSPQRSEVEANRTQSPCWQPGPRRCTQCGDVTHTIYNCPKKKQAFFFS